MPRVASDVGFTTHPTDGASNAGMRNAHRLRSSSPPASVCCQQGNFERGQGGGWGYFTACLRWGEPLNAPGGCGEQERLWLPVALIVRGLATTPRAAR